MFEGKMNDNTKEELSLEGRTHNGWKSLAKEGGILATDTLLATSYVFLGGQLMHMNPEKALHYGYCAGIGVILQYVFDKHRKAIDSGKPEGPQLA
jgi:O-antigen ligase